MVIALTPLEGVIAKTAIEGVFTVKADQGVMTSFSCDRIMECAASCGVITSTADEGLRSCFLAEVGQVPFDGCAIKGKA